MPVDHPTCPATMTHQEMVRLWWAGRAVPVSPRITDYACVGGGWWRRMRPGWEEIPDGPFALALTAGRARIDELTGRTDALGYTDPWTARRNQLRMGLSCRGPRDLVG